MHPLRSPVLSCCSLKVILVFLLYVFPSFYSVCVSFPSRKRKESEPRTKCLLNNADITPHHPTDPVEMRRINFQTPGTARTHTHIHWRTKTWTTYMGNPNPKPGHNWHTHYWKIWSPVSLKYERCEEGNVLACKTLPLYRHMCFFTVWVSFSNFPQKLAMYWHH